MTPTSRGQRGMTLLLILSLIAIVSIEAGSLAAMQRLQRRTAEQAILRDRLGLRLERRLSLERALLRMRKAQGDLNATAPVIPVHIALTEEGWDHVRVSGSLTAELMSAEDFRVTNLTISPMVSPYFQSEGQTSRGAQRPTQVQRRPPSQGTTASVVDRRTLAEKQPPALVMDQTHDSLAAESSRVGWRTTGFLALWLALIALSARRMDQSLRRTLRDSGGSR